MNTQTTTMQELAELATLDAFGLLDAEDQFRLEKAFLRATPEVQAELRRIQAELVLDTDLLPDVTPSEDLKMRVLQRVRAAIDLDRAGISAAPHIPITPERGIAGRIAGNVWTWRMAALVLLGVSVTLMIMATDGSRHFNELLRETTSLQANAMINGELGPESRNLTEMFNRPTVRQVYLVAESGEGLVRVSIDEVTGEAFVLAIDLGRQAGPCLVEITSESGDLLASTELRTDRYFDGVKFELDPTLIAGAQLRLIDAQGNTIATGSMA